MSVFDKMLDGRSLYDLAIERIRHYARSDGKNLVAFSGGKDSQCVYHLCKEAGITFTAQYSVTRFEPPELMAFIREYYPDVVFRRAYKMSLVKQIELQGLPTRWSRWCCDCKHAKTDGFPLAFIGVRGEESPRRRDTWRTFGMTRDGTAYCCSIFDWATADVWEYLGARGIPHCSLYDEGLQRIGCVLCPLVSQKKRDWDAQRWPRHAAMFRKGARMFADRMRAQGWKTKRGRDCADWCKAKDPAEELFQRWLNTGCTILKKREDEEEPCVFEGSGFSEKDGARE